MICETFDEFKETYPELEYQITNAMEYGIMRFLHLLDKNGCVPLHVINGVDLLAVEIFPGAFPELALTVQFTMTNEYFFIKTIYMVDDDIIDIYEDYFSNAQNPVFPIMFYEPEKQNDLMSITPRVLHFVKHRRPSSLRSRTLLSYTENTDFNTFHLDEDFIQNFNYSRFVFDPKYDLDCISVSS